MFTHDEKLKFSKQLQIYSNHMRFDRTHIFIEELSISDDDKKLLHEQTREFETLREKYVSLLERIMK